jgi:hypothetical protein
MTIDRSKRTHNVNNKPNRKTKKTTDMNEFDRTCLQNIKGLDSVDMIENKCG